MASFFSELITATDEHRRSFETHPAVLDAVAQGMTLDRYRSMLLELYQVVWHFNPVCAMAASRMGSPANEALQPVRHFLYEHMFEEKGHESWVLNDLAAIGVPNAQAQGHEAGEFTLALIGYNHWCAQQQHPCSVLGMLYALEVIASVYGGPFASAMREALLLDGDAGVSFIDSHASLDAQHMAELRVVLNQVNDAVARAAVVQSVRVNFHHFQHLVAAL